MPRSPALTLHPASALSRSALPYPTLPSMTLYRLVKMAWRCWVAVSRFRTPCISAPPALSPETGFPTARAGLSCQPPEVGTRDILAAGDRLTARGNQLEVMLTAKRHHPEFPEGPAEAENKHQTSNEFS